MSYRISTFLFVLSTMCAMPAGLAAQSADAPVDPALLAFAEKVRACEVATAEQTHPLVPGFTIEHAITGGREAACDYSQSMPGDMHMICVFDASTLAAYADELEQAATTGQMAGSSSGAQPVWTSSCEIETAAGERLPLGTP